MEEFLSIDKYSAYLVFHFGAGMDVKSHVVTGNGGFNSVQISGKGCFSENRTFYCNILPLVLRQIDEVKSSPQTHSPIFSNHIFENSCQEVN